MPSEADDQIQASPQAMPSSHSIRTRPLMLHLYASREAKGKTKAVTS